MAHPCRAPRQLKRRPREQGLGLSPQFLPGCPRPWLLLQEKQRWGCSQRPPSLLQGVGNAGQAQGACKVCRGLAGHSRARTRTRCTHRACTGCSRACTRHAEGSQGAAGHAQGMQGMHKACTRYAQGMQGMQRACSGLAGLAEGTAALSWQVPAPACSREGTARLAPSSPAPRPPAPSWSFFLPMVSSAQAFHAHRGLAS